MAKRGSTKQLSIEHETFIARKYGGKRSASSGAADTDNGDVRTDHALIECKLSGGPGRSVALHTPTLVQTMAKIALEAWEEGREPAVALRYYVPGSPLADHEGWVDLTVRLTVDDIHRGI